MKSTHVLFAILFCSAVSAKEAFRGDGAIVRSEFIYQQEEVSFPSCHASTIAETKDGLIASWFGGPAEKDPDVGIWTSRYVQGKWTVPVEVANGVQHKNLMLETYSS